MKLKRLLAIVLAIVLVISTFPVTVFAEGEQPEIIADSTYGMPGDTAEVVISLKNNPGIISAKIGVSFPEELTLISATAGSVFSTLSYTAPNQLKNGGTVSGSCNFVWSGSDIDSEDIKDGVILTLIFSVAKTAELNSDSIVTISCGNGSIVDKNMAAVNVVTTNATIRIIDYKPGDVDSSSTVNMMDVVKLCRYIVDDCTYDPLGYAINLKEDAAEVNGDGNINMLDVVALCRYIVDNCTYDPDGYGIKLQAAYKECAHSLEAVAAKAVSCTVDGNIAYWHCTKCDKYYADAEAKERIALEDTVIKSPGHLKVVVDSAVPATPTSIGYTEGSHCETCGTVIVAQEEIPIIAITEHNIIYHVANGDSYIQSLLDNGTLSYPAAAKCKYEEGAGLSSLPQLEIAGYLFMGWYDGAASNAQQVKSISSSEKDDIHLYAHWELTEPYAITFYYDTKLEGIIDTSEVKKAENLCYNVNKPKKLPVLTMPGYTFVGWSDEEGNICDTIERGSTGDKKFYANWLSDRNQAWALKNYGEPVIFEDDNVIAFAYKIGEVRNVPAVELIDFGKITPGGVPETKTTKTSYQTSESYVQAFSKAVEKSTTTDATWTLSSGWSDEISVTKEWYEEQGLTLEEAIAQSTTETGTWYVNTTRGGEKSTTTVDSTDEYDLTTETNNTKSYGSSEETTYGSKIEESGWNVNGKIEIGSTQSGQTSGIVKALGAEAKLTFEEKLTIEGGYESKDTDKTGSDTVDKTGEDYEEGSEDQVGTIKNHTDTTVDKSTWSNESGYSNSTSNTQSRELTNELSRKISEASGVGQSYISSENQEQKQGLACTNTDNYTLSSQVTYSKVTSTEEEITYTTGAAIEGYHRKVMAVTADVYGVIGYDKANRSYFTESYSILDDNYYRFDDYSYSSAKYDDNQTGLIDFEIPHDIYDYVIARTFYTEGLEFNKDGQVTKYSGESSLVIIPEYASIDNLDGTREAVKVTTLNSGIFTNNANITGIVLSDFMTDIPAEEFKNCSELWELYGTGIKTIGSDAFAGCKKMRSFSISSTITNIGQNAFSSCGFLEVDASSPTIVVQSVNSGAKRLAVGLANMTGSLDDLKDENTGITELVIPSSVKSFTLRGYGKEFSAVKLLSEAETTKLVRVTLNSDKTMPLKLNSTDVTLNQVTVNSPGTAAAMLAENTTLSIYGYVNLNSTTAGKNAVFVRTATIDKLDGNLSTGINVTGNLVTCGTVTDEKNILTFTKGELITVSAEEFERLLSSITVDFNAAGGEVSENERILNVDAQIGELPIPIRTGYDFLGWFTEETAGTPVSSSFVPTSDITLYAHWKVREFTVSWNNAVGINTTVTLTSSPYAGTEGGLLTSGDKVHYGDELAIDYNVKDSAAYTMTGHGVKSVTVYSNIYGDIWASASVNAYRVTWSQGEHTGITVSRTSSPYQNAGTGVLSYNDVVYYGDTLQITYTVDTGYTLGCGTNSITVKGNVDGNTIYSYASVNGYSYPIYYYSTNGTYLGQSSATYNYGTTNTLTPPVYSGYDTPAAQSVTWDSTAAKSIYFYYTPTAVATSQSAKSGNWFDRSWLTWVATIEYANRTSTTVDVRVKWVQTIKADYGYGYNTYFTATIGGSKCSQVTIGTGTQNAASSSKRVRTAFSDWKTVNVGTTAATTVAVSATYKDSNGNNSKTGSWSATAQIPAY